MTNVLLNVDLAGRFRRPKLRHATAATIASAYAALRTKNAVGVLNWP